MAKSETGAQLSALMSLLCGSLRHEPGLARLDRLRRGDVAVTLSSCVDLGDIVDLPPDGPVQPRRHDDAAAQHPARQERLDDECVDDED